jgi:hypothetical protein
MKFNSKKLTITGIVGETISLKVRAVGTEHKVTYNLAEDGDTLEENQALEFICKPSAQKTYLTMNFHYTQPDAGSFYKIEIAGEHGGTATYVVKQPDGAAHQRLFIRLDGNPDTHFPISDD